ncbi:MAG: PleD family two-component system response regulator, partial [Alphaproteobacteria bacterium]
MSARILVVDDVERNVRLLEAKLSAEYFEVITASGGQEALEKIRVAQPDIVLLDVMMPEMDGFEVCRRIRATPEIMHVPVIMVTALSEVEDKVRGLEAGADDFLTKPVDDRSLFARVKSLVRLKMTNDELRLRLQTGRQLGVLKPGQLIGDQDSGNAEILVVEHSEFAGRRCAGVLADDGNRVTVVGSADECMAKVDTIDFDLVLVSTDLAEDDPLRLLAQLRSNTRTRPLPIVAMLDMDDRRTFEMALDLGVTDFVAKPVEKSELLARARTQIRRKRFQDQLRQDYEQSIAMALKDSLTGCYNRRYLDAHLGGQVADALEKGKALSLLMLDIDLFKGVNDTHGHAAGDEVLIEVARRFSETIRDFDMLARFGGEEFVVAMPDAGPRIVGIVAERLRRAIADTPFALDGHEINITISIGVADTNLASTP